MYHYAIDFLRKTFAHTMVEQRDENLNMLKNFELEKMHASPNQATLIGKIQEQGAIVLLKPPTFDEKLSPEILSKFTNSEIKQKNDVYTMGSLSYPLELNTVLIYPANSEHLQKYSAKTHIFVDETYSDYLITLKKKLVDEEKRSYWISNIIENMHLCDITNMLNISDTCNSHLLDAYNQQLSKKNAKVLVTNDPCEFSNQQSLDNTSKLSEGPESEVCESNTNMQIPIRTDVSVESQDSAEQKSLQIGNSLKKVDHSLSENAGSPNLKKVKICTEKSESLTGIPDQSGEKSQTISVDSVSEDLKPVYDRTEVTDSKIQQEEAGKNGGSGNINEQKPSEPTALKETIYYNDEDFFIAANYQWDMKRIDQLYLNLMFKDFQLHTIREVQSIELLLKSKEKIQKVCSEQFNLEYKNVFVFFHYHPTYYRLHLHICHAEYFGHGCTLGKAIMLEDVISNLQHDIDFYKKAVLRYKTSSQ